MYFEKASQLNNSFSHYNLRVLYETGLGVTQNLIKAFQYYENLMQIILH